MTKKTDFIESLKVEPARLHRHTREAIHHPFVVVEQKSEIDDVVCDYYETYDIFVKLGIRVKMQTNIPPEARRQYIEQNKRAISEEMYKEIREVVRKELIPIMFDISDFEVREKLKNSIDNLLGMTEYD